MKRQEIKVKTYNLAIYPARLYVVFGLEKKASDFIYNNFLTYDGGEPLTSIKEDEYENARAVTFKLSRKRDDDFAVLIWLRKEITVGVIAHEAVHAAHFIFDAIGQDADNSNDEALAYLVGWIASLINETARLK